MERFAFIVHPIYHSDILKKFPLMRKCPENIMQSVFKKLPPFKVSHIEGLETPYNRAEGWFVACPLSSEQIMNLPRDYVINKIIKAGKKAEQLGADIVGLGALTAVVGDAGKTVSRHLDIPVTTGNSYTVATAIDGVKQASEMMGHDYRNYHVAILGASGSIGRVIAHKLAQDVRFLTLIGRDQRKLNKIADEVYQQTGLASKVSTNPTKSISQADAVIAVTGAVDAVISGEELKPGAIVCDVARPRDVSWRVAKNRDDVLVFEGGLVEVPGDVNFNFDFGFPSQTAYACMAETMILALEQKYECFSLGRQLTVKQVDRINQLAAKHNFKLAGLRSFEREVTKETIQKIKTKVSSPKDTDRSVITS